MAMVPWTAKEMQWLTCAWAVTTPRALRQAKQLLDLMRAVAMVTPAWAAAMTGMGAHRLDTLMTVREAMPPQALWAAWQMA
jgi:hypothetical protein